jgi:hypothetical protein
VLDEEQLLTAVTDPTAITPCVHGTYLSCWPLIQTGTILHAYSVYIVVLLYFHSRKWPFTYTYI